MVLRQEPRYSGQAGTEQPKGLSRAVVTLLKGVVYREDSPDLWDTLVRLQPQVRDYVSVMGLELHLDEAEGYAFLTSRPGDPEGPDIPRLVARRPLSYPVSLLLALLRKKLAEFDAHGGGSRLILSREDILDLVRLFLPEGSNEARLTDQVDSQINKVVQLGFLRRLRGQQGHYEVRRIIKAYVNAHWLQELDGLLREYREYWAGKENDDA